MKNTLQKTVLLFLLSVCIVSCSSDEGSSGSDVDYVKDAASLMRNMTIPGAVLKSGEIPVPEGVYQDNIVSMPNTVIVTSNSLFTIPIKTNTTDGRVPRMVFIKLDGSDQYYQIDLDVDGNPTNARNTNAEQPVRLNCSGYPNIYFEAQGADTTPSYTNSAEVYVYSPPLQSSPTDLTNFLNANHWSQVRTIQFKALDVGTGDVQISLTWDTQTDVDLWLTEPDGNKIYYANPNSSSGGELDYDNTEEYGPENIFYSNAAPSGTYKVEVDYFSGAPTTTHYNVVVKNGNNINMYEGTLSLGGQTNTVVEFTK